VPLRKFSGVGASVGTGTPQACLERRPEAAEWALDQVLEVAASGEEVGVGFDVAPLDGALESACWSLDRAVGALHAEIRAAVRHGVPLVLLAEASATDVRELRSVLHPSEAPAGPGLVVGGLATAGWADPSLVGPGLVRAVPGRAGSRGPAAA
jgi:hypothetical protein